jgi:bacteriocin biosynthesis cyclodehydratase domain-containing protein
MAGLPARPALALPFTILSGPDQVRLVAGDDFRFTLSGRGLEAWLPDWLRRLDGRLTLDEALAQLPAETRPAARAIAERLASERVLADGPVESAHHPRRYRLAVEGEGCLRAGLEALAGEGEGDLAVLCQDRPNLAEALAFNDRRLRAATPWLWVSCAAMSRGYVSPAFLPDAGPCLACLLGHFRRRSPLPELYDDLVGHGQCGGAFTAVPFPECAAAVLVWLAAWKAELLARPEAPAALFRLHVLEVTTLEVTSHPVLLDPECPGCHGRR